MFNIMTRAFADCDIELPAGEGLPNLEAYRDGGVTVLPPLFKAQFVPRSDRPIL